MFSSLKRQEWLFILLASKQSISTKIIIDPAPTVDNRIVCWRFVNDSRKCIELSSLFEDTCYIWHSCSYFFCTSKLKLQKWGLETELSKYTYPLCFVVKWETWRTIFLSLFLREAHKPLFSSLFIFFFFRFFPPHKRECKFPRILPIKASKLNITLLCLSGMPRWEVIPLCHVVF